MSVEIKITAGEVELQAQLNDSVTAKLIAGNLPIQASGQRWGGEIYFAIDVNSALESDARDVLEEGELGYWPTGNAFCIFFGATPASQGNEIRAASAVNIVGKINGDISKLWDVENGASVLIESA